MSELIESDASDNDIFVIKQIKPLNKVTLKDALVKKHNVLNSLHSEQRNKNENGGNLSTELERNKKKENGIPKSFKNEFSKSVKMIKKNRSPRVSNRNKIFEDNIKETCQKNKLKNIKGKSSENKVQCCLEEIKSEKGPPTKNIKSLPIDSSRAKYSESHLLEKQKNDCNNSRKRVELSPEFFQKRKKLKNGIVTLMPLKTNEFVKKQLGLPEAFVEMQEGNSSVKEKLESEVSSDIGNDDKSEIKFEELSSSSQLEGEFDEVLGFYRKGQEEEYGNSSELLCFLLKKIISDETKKQTELEQKSCLKGKAFQQLLSENECEIFDKFFNLEDNACKLFVRMLIRKKDWHRVSTIVYKDIGEDIEKYFNILEKVNFIDNNIEDEDLKTQLKLLSKPEVLKLCKAFNICFKAHSATKKDILIKSLVEECKKQKSIIDIIKGKNSIYRLDLLKSQIKKCLGMCIRINEKTFKAFSKVLVLFSFAHYFDDNEKRFSAELYMCLRIFKNIIKFPNYKLSPSVVFETPGDFEEYEASLTLLNTFEVAISNKNHDTFITVVTKVKNDFKNVLKNYEYHKRFLTLPSFLQIFSAGTVYARILTKYCQTFKRKADDSDIVKTVKLLLEQNLFLQRKRGDWYEILAKALENQKENNTAAEVIINALKDPFVNEIQRLTLQLRGQGILRKKNCGVSDVQLRKELDSKCTVPLEEPVSIEIKGKALDGIESGFKCVYVQDTGYGKEYTSVEEKAVCYYKSQGFTRGYHVEGYIVHSLYFIIFFDIIYGLSPEGVFQSPYQEAPLDFNSTSFYINRKHEIDKLLTDLLNWDDLKVETTVKDVYSRNHATTCIINWNDDFTPELFCEVIKCITMPILVLIFQRLIKNFGAYRSGFPDLTLWNPETNEIKFVEVKSPNDKLSPGQRLWLSYLRQIGLSSEVCNVKNSSGRKLC